MVKSSSVLAQFKNSRIPLSQWILALTAAVVVVTVVVVLVGGSLLAVSRPQEVRSRASTGESRLTPQLTSLEISSDSNQTETSPAPQLAVIDEAERVAQADDESTTATDSTDTEQGENTLSEGVIEFDEVPAGVSFVYILIGLGVVIGGLAIGLIVLVKKFAGV